MLFSHPVVVSKENSKFVLLKDVFTLPYFFQIFMHRVFSGDELLPEQKLVQSGLSGIFTLAEK